MFACIYCKSVSGGASLVDFAYGFSPLVEASDAHTIVIDARGCEVLFGSFYELANEMSRRALTARTAGGLGCRINVALAANPDTAILAAHFFTGLTFISPGEESAGIGGLPIEALSPTNFTSWSLVFGLGSWDFDCFPKTEDQRPKTDKLKFIEQKIGEILDTLRLWGVATFSDLAKLPTAGVAQRLGQEGVRLQRLAQGKNDRQLVLIQPPPGFEQSIELEHPIDRLEPLSFILGRLLNQLCANLNAHALAANELRLRLELEGGTKHERTITLPVPMRDSRVFLRLLLLDAEMHPPQAAIGSVTIAVEPAAPRALQNGLFVPLAPEPEKLEVTLARLGKLVGAGNAGSPELLDTHRPDAFRVRRFRVHFNHRGHSQHCGLRIADCGFKNSKFEIRNSKFLLGFRVFRPPLNAQVQTVCGQPKRVKAQDKRCSLDINGRVLRASGPWRTSGDWWRADNWARDEWDVAIESRAGSKKGNGHADQDSQAGGASAQALYRVYRDLHDGAWFVEGVYD
jgi:protein ImuB